MNKTIRFAISSAVILGSVVSAGALAFAQSATTTMAAPASTSIVCVGTAVAAREQALDAGVTTRQAAVSAAYTARASALASAYALTTPAQVHTAVKAAWSTFNASVKSANTAWKSAHNTAWSTFKSAAQACHPKSGVSDASKSSTDGSSN
jgi:hypothetical protein